MHSTRQWKNKRRKLTAIGCGKFLKEERKDMDASSILATACESCLLQVSTSIGTLEESSDQDLKSRFLEVIVDRKNNKSSSTIHTDVTDALRGSNTNRSQSLSTNRGCLIASSRNREHNSKDGLNQKQLQCYQHKLGKGRDAMTPRIPTSQPKAQPWCKSTSNVDLSQSMTCTPSYRLLPIKYMRQTSSLHPLRAQVLNDHWVCVPSGSPNSNLKCTQRNLYEEKLQECEDDCCEVDVLLESTRAAIRRMEDLLTRVESGGEVLVVSDYLTVMDWRCCDHLHGEFGLEVEDMILKDPCTALPVVIDKLKQKQEEIMVMRESFKKSLREILNEGKSLMTKGE